MTKQDNEDFKDPTKCWICDNDYTDSDVKIIVISLENIVVLCTEIVISVCSTNHKIPLVFHNLKNYDPHLIMQELGKVNLKINVIPNELEKHMSFSINNKLSLIVSNF